METEVSQTIRRVEDLIDFLVASIDDARVVDEPFYHLEFDGIFPQDLYQTMLAAMPEYSDYRPMSGRSKDKNSNRRATRVKIDLFPEYVSHLPEEKKPVWKMVGTALCSEPVKNAFRRKLAPALEHRFGPPGRPSRLGMSRRGEAAPALPVRTSHEPCFRAPAVRGMPLRVRTWRNR